MYRYQQGRGDTAREDQSGGESDVSEEMAFSEEEKSTFTPISTTRNRQKVLLLSTRGVTYRQRHLMNDFVKLMPHSKKDVKMDTKSKLFRLNEMAELYNCNNVMCFEARKHGQDFYMWLAKAPNGPTVKLHIQNIHTMEEMNMPGNCLKGSRPILSFDKAFDDTPATRLLKEIFIHMFGVPKGARRSKPFVDHVLSLSLGDGKVWFRNYQIKESEAVEKTEISLIEIGPRFVMTPILIQEGSFRGPILYENKQFVSPNQVRSAHNQKTADKYNRSVNAEISRKARKVSQLPAFDPLADDILFADD